MSELKKPREREGKHKRLERMSAELSLLHHAFKAAVEKSFNASRPVTAHPKGDTTVGTAQAMQGASWNDGGRA